MLPDRTRICAYCGTTFPLGWPTDPKRFCSRRCGYDNRMIPLADRFWSKIDRAGECWTWTALRNFKGYGTIQASGAKVWAHHVAWEIASGESVPEGFGIYHACDTPACVRNDELGTYVVRGRILPRWGHLFMGVTLDNVHDREDKGHGPTGSKHPYRPLGERHKSVTHPDSVPRGERHGNAKLTTAQVIEIRQRYAAGHVTMPTLAAEFGVGKSLIGYIVNRQLWRHIS